MKVICINDRMLPLGANIKKDKEYEVIETFINSYDEVVYVVGGVVNSGRTRFGLPWEGYKATRFTKQIDEVEEVEEQMVEEYA
mgnify:FL=1